MASRVEKYLAHLDDLTGGVEPTFTPVESTHDGLKGVTVCTYRDLPVGLTTFFTYGLSLAGHPDWRDGSPELCTSVRSAEPHWGITVGQVAESLRGRHRFRHGETIDVGRPIAPDSVMSAFVVFAPAVVDRDDCRVDVSAPGQGSPDVINLVGLYPIHGTERQYVDANGIEAFWRLDWDMYDVTRGPVV